METVFFLAYTRAEIRSLARWNVDVVNIKVVDELAIIVGYNTLESPQNGFSMLK